jgi:23S rRNA pseudouridine1911/1915/1917 synthase
MIVSSNVPASSSGMIVPAYLANRFTYLSEAAWCQLVEEGRIACNGVLCDRATTVAKGDTIRCDMPDFGAPTVNLDYSIVYEDDWLLAVDKPAGLRVHSGGKFVNANLMHHLRHVRMPPYPEVNLVNRLDADTSGLVLLARDKTVLNPLMQQFADGTVVKHYLAVVMGRPSPAAGTITLPIGPVKDAKVPRYGVNKAHGKAAVTHYQTLRELTEKLTLLELKPESGRTHQLRVHMAAMGHPIAGDALYTLNDDDYLDWIRNPAMQSGLKRQALHSYQLQFFHPAQKTTCTLTAPLAPDIAQFIRDVTTAGQSTV